MSLALPTSPLKRWAMTAVAVLIIYGNVAVIFSPGKLGMPGVPGLPRPFALRDAFLMTGMFNSYTRYNSGFRISGHRLGDARPGRGWFKLTLKEHFPHRMGVTYTQIFAVRYWDTFGTSAQKDAWAVMARKIRLRHNRLHPDSPVDRIRIGAARWPIDPRGYYAGKRAGQVRYQQWFVEPPP